MKGAKFRIPEQKIKIITHDTFQIGILQRKHWKRKSGKLSDSFKYLKNI